ncbi:MAG TPA: hypothetical protein VK989_02200 [Polyangia bacterium]|jgi:hypothetical protein|nr:hypothetical protein [Polyangia bacterium]
MKLGLTVAIGAVAALSGATARAERPRIAVMEIAGGKVTPDLRERVTHAVDEGLLASGADVVDGMPAAATGPGGAPCDGNGCVEAVAKATVAAYVLRGTLEIDGRTYELRLEMLDGKTGVLIESREDRCEICTEGEALEMAGVSASALKVQVFKKKPPVPVVDPAGAAVATVAAPPGAVRIETSAPPMSEPRASGHRELGWIGVAAGVVAVAAGIVLISIDGNGTCDAPSGTQCRELRSTKGGGIAALVGGAVLGGAGALVLTGKF